jgi:iron complex outermembrane receptor protein
LWIGPTNMVMRPQNTFNLERIELLRGAASALYGQGSVGGVINAVTKKATRSDRRPVDLTATYGRFDTVELGAGSGGPLSEKSWYRLDAAHTRSDGYVERMDPRSTNATGSLLFGLREDLDLRVSVDYLDDQLANYWGTPLTPAAFTGANEARGVIRTLSGETLDRRVLRTNYNVTDGLAESDQLFLRADVRWQGRRTSFESTLYHFDAERAWANAEGFYFNQATTQIDRTNGFFFVLHDQDLLGSRSHVTHRSEIGGRDNRLAVGLEAYDLDFVRSRGFRFSEQPGDSVDFLDPKVGVYGPRELRGVSPTQIETRALFVEDLLQITDSFSLLASVRAEWLDLVRENFGRTGGFEAGSSFSRDFSEVSFKLGGVYRANDSVSIFGQYGNATDPVNSNLFLVNAGEDFDLTSAEQWELGVKGLWLGGRAEGSLTLYDLSRDDVLEQIGVDSASIVGGRDASGIELATAFSPSSRLRLGLNASYTKAEFRPSENFVRNAGNQPPNVPEIVANLFVQVNDIAGLPLDAGIDVRHVGDRFGDNANTVTLESYTLAGVFVGYRWGATQLTTRVTNLTDEIYSPWADVFYLQQTDPSFPYANQVLIGAPRSYELSVRARF